MQTFQDRLRSLIDTLGITKTKFAEDLHVSSAFVSMLCSGKSLPSDRTIADICRKYNVSETWLRTGEGEMFEQTRASVLDRLSTEYDLSREKLTRNQEIAEFMGVVMHDPDDAPRKRFVSIISKLSADEWQLLAEIAKKMAEDE